MLEESVCRLACCLRQGFTSKARPKCRCGGKRPHDLGVDMEIHQDPGHEVAIRFVVIDNEEAAGDRILVQLGDGRGHQTIFDIGDHYFEGK